MDKKGSKPGLGLAQSLGTTQHNKKRLQAHVSIHPRCFWDLPSFPYALSAFYLSHLHTESTISQRIPPSSRLLRAYIRISRFSRSEIPRIRSLRICARFRLFRSV
nr:hypothetical protein Iba_chr12fCG6760 [Ipomoea batatas]